MAVLNETALEVSLAGVERARARIRDYIFLSPCLRSAEITRMAGQEIYLKLDNRRFQGAGCAEQDSDA